MDPRRVEGLGNEVDGALRFDRTSTTTHSVGRPLIYEAGTYTSPLTEQVLWYGDDHSRLVVLGSALPLRGGRATSGPWAEYAWGSQPRPPRSRPASSQRHAA